MVSGPKKITRTGMYNYCWPGCLTVMFDVSKVGLIQIKDIKKNNDYAMWLKVCHKADCFLLDECLGQYRKGRTGSVSTHSIGTMVGWHYKLFHEAEAMGCISSLFNTGRNLVFGLYKKKKYVKRQDMNNNEAMIITLKDSTIYKIRRKIQILAFNIFGPDTMTKIYFKHLLGYSLNLKSPKTFNEKLCWYKLNYCPHNRLVIRCADKYYVRGYLKKKGYAKHLINILGVWDNPEQIEWSKLPKKFALKRTNGCGYNIICLDKEKLDEKYVKNLLKSWQKEKFGKYNVEPHYNRVKGKIICEEYIESCNRLPVDYKVHCFNGEPEFIMVCDGRNNKGTSFGYFDLTRKYLPYSKSAASFELDLEDAYLDEMISISKDIATDFPFVRVDFYISNSKLFIGELTFTPTAGYDYTITRAGDKAIGDLFNIEELMEKK